MTKQEIDDLLIPLGFKTKVVGLHETKTYKIDADYVFIFVNEDNVLVFPEYRNNSINEPIDFKDLKPQKLLEMANQHIKSRKVKMQEIKVSRIKEDFE